MLHFLKNRAEVWLCAVILALIIPSVAAADAIFVTGEVSGVWSADSVIVSDSIYVSADDTLEIEPGVEVFFLAAYSFRIYSGAVLQAIGTETDSISFLPMVEGYSTLGIDFHDASDASIMEYCYISRALYSAITVRGSNLTIRRCLLEDNPGYFQAGGITLIEGSEAIIENNTIRGNTSTNQGGAIYCDSSSPIISGNIIDGNSTGQRAGAIFCNSSSNPVIIDNTIINNFVNPIVFPPVLGQGGAIFLDDEATATITGNLFSNNRVEQSSEPGANGGGAVFVFSAYPDFEKNIFAGNVAESGNGGAIYLFNTNAPVENNVFVNNSAEDYGGAIYIDLSAYPYITNSILYDNYAPNGPEIYLDDSGITVSYSDIKGGWEGEGNIDSDPLFRDPDNGDYHLMFTYCGDAYSSPCIDAGDPELFDSSLGCDSGLATFRSDMGAYGGGGEPPAVAVSMTPDNAPVQVPAGGSFTYTGTLSNATGDPYTVNVGTFVFSDEYGLFGPLSMIYNIPIEAHDTLTAPGVSQDVPGDAPQGMYRYIAICSEAPFEPISSASFYFEVLAPSGGSVDWNSSNWFKEDINEPVPSECLLLDNYPNPFNAKTTISFDIAEAGDVNLSVYNIAGQLVQTITNGNLRAGEHRVTWDASSVSSGVYFYRLQAGDFVAIKKMNLVK
ncbi:MAG: T9SS type A sorting domain-containing protein [candidate division Zixibacteria bacterium]|nr:T9SS type A sorting domain-containing protein [candidate division Zixibacteria bacterium]